MIRTITKYDKPKIIEIMKLFRSESNAVEFKSIDNEPYWNMLLDSIIAGQGVCFYEEDIGILMAVITPSIWCNKTFTLHEIAWYVKPEYRNTSIGYRLLKRYIEYGKALKEEKRIKFFIMGKMPSSPDIKYSKFGFRKIDESWIQ